MLFKFFGYCITAVFTLVLLWAAGWLWFAASTASMKPYDTAVKTDAIVVLTGGEKRVDTGLDLLADGRAEYLFISGVNKQVKPAELVSLWGKDGDKIMDKIVLGYSADDTASNARESQEWIRQNDIKSIRLVTANYHMTRSLLNFHKELPDVVIYKHPVVPNDFKPWQEKFWPLTFSEYNKVLATWLRFDLLHKNPKLETPTT